MKSGPEGWLPVERPAVGLISWYDENGAVKSLATSWLAVIDGSPPELRAGCLDVEISDRWRAGGRDFAVNVAGPLVAALPSPEVAGHFCILPARSVDAPLLAGFQLHIECAGGRLYPREWEAELVGEVRLLHRNGTILDPADHPQLSMLRPLQTAFPS